MQMSTEPNVTKVVATIYCPVDESMIEHIADTLTAIALTLTCNVDDVLLERSPGESPAGEPARFIQANYTFCVRTDEGADALVCAGDLVATALLLHQVSPVHIYLEQVSDPLGAHRLNDNRG